eukprot:3235387-Amphidinium_carterae.1
MATTITKTKVPSHPLRYGNAASSPQNAKIQSTGPQAVFTCTSGQPLTKTKSGRNKEHHFHVTGYIDYHQKIIS